MNKKRILKYLRNLIIFFFASSILSVVALKFIPVYITPLMVIRSVEQLAQGEKIVMKHHWVPKEKISRHLPMAVIASEDNRFASHNGFDFKEISKAMKENKKRKKARGASTISQQTAKNVFLWPSSSWVRKGLMTARDAYQEVHNTKTQKTIKKTTKKKENKPVEVSAQDQEELRRLMEGLGGDL